MIAQDCKAAPQWPRRELCDRLLCDRLLWGLQELRAVDRLDKQMVHKEEHTMALAPSMGYPQTVEIPDGTWKTGLNSSGASLLGLDREAGHDM